MKLFAVFGNPVLHSRSPQLWNAAFQALGLDAHYFRINPLEAEQAAKILRALPLAGCNVTTPFKHDLLAALDEADESVTRLEAVNTIKNDGGRLIGWNTDHFGAVASLREGGVDPRGKKIVMLGAGGAARAAIYGVMNAGAREVVILNRTYENAVKTAEQLGCRAAYASRSQVELRDADILIACIPANKRVIKPEWLHERLAVFDANYAADSLLLQDAAAVGCRVISGLNWLVHQAVPAFAHLLGASPEREMRDALRQSIITPASKLDALSVSLIGFMGTGKTTVGKALAELTGKAFVDADTLIEQKAGQSIPDIFRQRGEARFRELEREVFAELDFSPGKIVSCGGGAILNEENRRRLKANSTVVWLWTDVATLIKRVEKGTRPLFDVDDVEAKANELLARRIPFYAQTADLMVMNDTLSAPTLARKIYGEIYPTGSH